MKNKLDLMEMDKVLLMLFFAACGAGLVLWLFLTWWLLTGLPPINWGVLGGMLSLTAGAGVIAAACRP